MAVTHGVRNHVGHAYMISMGKCKKSVTPLLTPWSFVFLALTRRYNHKGGSVVRTR